MDTGCPVPLATYPEASDGQPSNASLFGLATDGVYQACRVTTAAGGLLPRLFTLTRRLQSQQAVCFLWHFPWGHPRSALRTILPCVARTFLCRVNPAAITRCLLNMDWYGLKQIIKPEFR